MNMMPKMIKPFMTQFSSNFKSALFCFHSSAHSSGYRYHAISRTQSHSAVSGCSPSGWMPGVAPRAPRAVTVALLTVEQLLYWSGWICTGRAAQIEAKTKFRFGNIVPKQLTLSGFIQHTIANSMYKDDNKISRQQKVLHMNKMLERVPHFQTSFGVGIQPLS